MKLFYIIAVLILFQSCSFDNKSGIWTDEKNIQTREEKLFKDFELITTLEESFDKEIQLKGSYKFNLPALKVNNKWNDIYYNNNKSINFKYNEKNNLIFKSKKISKHKTSNFLLYDNNNIVSSDSKGNIIVYSLINKNIISKFNFYKKKHRNIEKSLNIIIDNKIIYISDNIGYLYAYDYFENKLLWAKNYKIPFRSNLKIKNNKLIGANQNKTLFFLDTNDGSIIQSFPTEDNTIKNKFINNLSTNRDRVFFLNTYGSIYSINPKTMRLEWFKNLNQTRDINPGNLFFGNQIINDDENLIINSNNHTYVIDIKTGKTIHKKNFSSRIKPLLLNNILFIISKKNLLIAFDIDSGNIIYSYDINKSISDHLKIKKREVDIKSMMMINNKIFIFLKNSYLLKFRSDGKIKEIQKFSAGIKSLPIIIDNALYFLDKKNKLMIIG